VTEPNWAGGWRPAGYRPLPPVRPRGQRSRGQRAALHALRLALDGLAKVLVLLMRLSFQLISASLRLLLPAIGAQGAIKRVGRL
jgi:hypothetical protein